MAKKTPNGRRPSLLFLGISIRHTSRAFSRVGSHRMGEREGKPYGRAEFCLCTWMWCYYYYCAFAARVYAIVNNNVFGRNVSVKWEFRDRESRVYVSFHPFKIKREKKHEILGLRIVLVFGIGFYERDSSLISKNSERLLFARSKFIFLNNWWVQWVNGLALSVSNDVMQAAPRCDINLEQ